MLEELTFLEEGKFTHIDEIVKNKARELAGIAQGEKQKILHEISKYLFRIASKDRPELFRKRTASEIILSGFTTGSTDKTLVFLTLARENGIPSAYIEAFEKYWLQETRFPIQGHVFAQIFFADQWRIVEPSKGPTRGNEYKFNERLYIEAGKGIDFSRLYVKQGEIYAPNPEGFANKQALMDLARRIKCQSK